MRGIRPAFGWTRRSVRAALVFALFVSAVLAAGAGQRESEFSGVERIVAVGDLHGAYDSFARILRGTGLVDESLHWSGGAAHLVQIGDVLDRGPDARKIFDLIRRLEDEAAAAGGRVHMLIGNHEALALLGMTFDYDGFVTVEQLLSFLPENVRQRTEEEFRRRAGPEADLAPLWRDLARRDLGIQSAYFDFLRERYGLWLAGHDTAVKIDRIVFVHGGFSEEYSRWSLGRLNQAVSQELCGAIQNRPIPRRVVFDARGPLWYRDDARSQESVMNREIDRVLENLKATALVVGHTPTDGSRTLGRMSRFGGRVWTIDTGIWNPRTGRLGALIIKNGSFRVWGEGR